MNRLGGLLIANAELEFFTENNKIFITDKNKTESLREASKEDLEDYAVCLNSPWSINDENYHVKFNVEDGYHEPLEEALYKCGYKVVGYDRITSYIIGYGNTPNEVLLNCQKVFQDIQSKYNPEGESF